MLVYNPNLYKSDKDYLIQLITSVLGEGVKNRFGADWCGFDVWSLENKEFEGQFILIDDNNNVIHLNRVNDENGNVDTDIKEFHTNFIESEQDSEIVLMYEYLKEIFLVQ